MSPGCEHVEAPLAGSLPLQHLNRKLDDGKRSTGTDEIKNGATGHKKGER